MLNVLFVCLGNICRSPIAEGVFRQLVADGDLSAQIECDSAGTASYHLGDLPDRRSRNNALEHGLTLTHRARRLIGEDLGLFTYIVAMDSANFEAILKLSHRSVGLIPDENVFLLREFDPVVSDQPDVPDPYYEGPEIFEEVYQIVLRCCGQLLAYLTQEHELTLQPA